MSPEQVEDILSKQKATAVAAKQSALRQKYALQNAKTWGPLLASISDTRAILHTSPLRFMYGSWYDRAYECLHKARLNIVSRCYDEPAHPGWKFWYDFDGYIARDARKLVADYPDGPDKCPIKVL